MKTDLTVSALLRRGGVRSVPRPGLPAGGVELVRAGRERTERPSRRVHRRRFLLQLVAGASVVDGLVLIRPAGHHPEEVVRHAVGPG